MQIFQESLIESQRISFIALLDADKRRTKNKRCANIKIFRNIGVRPEVNSFSYIMLIAPFLSMIDGELPIKTGNSNAMKIDITKIGEAIEKGRGYVRSAKDAAYILCYPCRQN